MIFEQSLSEITYITKIVEDNTFKGLTLLMVLYFIIIRPNILY